MVRHVLLQQDPLHRVERRRHRPDTGDQDQRQREHAGGSEQQQERAVAEGDADQQQTPAAHVADRGQREHPGQRTETSHHGEHAQAHLAHLQHVARHGRQHRMVGEPEHLHEHRQRQHRPHQRDGKHHAQPVDHIPQYRSVSGPGARSSRRHGAHRSHHQPADQRYDRACEHGGGDAVPGDHDSADQPSQGSHAPGADRLQRDRVHRGAAWNGIGHQRLRGRGLERMPDAGKRDQHERHPEWFEARQDEDRQQRQQQRPIRGRDPKQPIARHPIADRSG